MKSIERTEIHDKLDEVFKPGSPISTKSLLFGREQEVYDLMNIIRRDGQHAIVIGDRGVGKTSLVKTVLNELEKEYLLVTCNGKANYTDVFKHFLTAMEVDMNEKEITTETNSKSELKSDIKVIGGSVNSEDIHKVVEKISSINKLDPIQAFELLKQANTDNVLVLDEYDSLNAQDKRQSSEFHTDVAYTIKTLGDQNDVCRNKVIIVGVSRSSEELIGKHESIRRNLREIYLRPLKQTHVIEYLEHIEDHVGIKFEEAVKADIAKTSLGYPYFCHLVGLDSVEHMLARNPKSLTVTISDYNEGYRTAADKAFRAELSKYKDIFYEMTTREEKNLLIAIAVSKNYPVERKSLKKDYENYKIKGDFEKVLLKLTQDLKVIYLSRHSDRIRFYDPLLRPFLLKFFNIKYSELLIRDDQNPTLFDE